MGDKKTGATALQRLSEVEIARGRFPDARRQLTTALRLLETLQDPQGIAETCIALGRLHWMVGEFDQALRVYRKAEHLFRRIGNETGIGEVLHVQGAVHFDRGDVGLAEKFYQEALALRRKTHDHRGLVRTLNNLGAVWMSQRLERSVGVWREALQIARDLGDLGFQATLADNLGEALMLLGRHDEARDALARAIELAELTGRRPTLIDALRNLALLESACGAWEQAETALARAQREAEGLGLTRLVALVQRAIGDVGFARIESTGVVHEAGEAGNTGPMATAEAAFRKAASDFETAGYDLEAATSHERLAELLGLAGRAAEGEGHRQKALELRRSHLRPSAPPPVPG